jgi:hypothetical protein
MSEILENFELYILNETNMQNYLKYKLEDNSEPKKITKTDNIKNIKKYSIFIPREQDTLFWCYYIIKNGDIKYETLINRNTLTTKQLKIDYIPKIRANKSLIKPYKFDSIANIESNLANDNNINIKTIFTLCVIDNINLIFVSKKTYYEFFISESSDVYIIYEVELQSKYTKKYGFEMATTEKLNEIYNTLYKIEIIDKPIKGLSAYKVCDLLNIANKLAIETVNKETGKNKNKNELYESIVQYF